MGLLTAPTLKDILREARLFLNQPEASNSFWSDEELTRYVNDGIRQYFLVITEVGEGQFDTSTTLDIAQGVETVDLPTDCFEVRAVYTIQANQTTMLRYYNNLSESYFNTNSASIEVYAPYYYFRGNSLVLRPVPGFTQAAAIKLEYCQFPQTLITGGDTLTNSLSPIFKELVVKYAVYQAKLKESSVQGGNTYAAVERVLQDLFARFKESVASRSKFPQTIRPFNP